MPRNLIIFGNGLGRSLDSNFFNLETAMTHAWENTECLNAAAKELIQGCLPEERDIPNSEDDLEDIYYAIISCVLLNYMARNCNEENHFLTQHGKSFLTNVRIFITEVASYFHTYEGEGLSDEFVQPLVQHIKETKSHVATLNYDRLLYECFLNNDVFGRYDTASILDGMTDGGFQKTNLDRGRGRDFGWYLHLHGSPLFRDVGESIRKFTRAQLREDINNSVCSYSNHIVLSAVSHKKDYIRQSELLSAYWEYLNTAIDEAQRITVFGYSGADSHLSERIKAKGNGKPVRVVKRISDKTPDEEQSFWNSLLGENVEVVRMENILRFTDW